MDLENEELLSELEKTLKNKFNKDVPRDRIQSTASDPRQGSRVNQLTLSDKERGRMPYTKEKYIIRENPQLIEWEREVRKFLRNLSPEHGHRVTAVMIFEWATGLLIKELMEDETARGTTGWRADLRKINKVLEYYFGKPYTTYILGRKVHRAYRVKPGHYIRRRRPMSITLYAEYLDGVLYP